MNTRARVFAALGAVAVLVPVVVVLGSRRGDSIDTATRTTTTTTASTGTATSSTTTAGDGPRIDVPSGTIDPGSSVKISGTHFPHDAAGVLTLGTERIGTFHTTKGGRFSLTIDVPRSARGDMTLTAVAGGSTARADLSFGGAQAPGAPAGGAVVMAVGDLTETATDADAVAVRDVVAAEKPVKVLMLGDYQYKYGSSSAIDAGADRIWGPKPAGLWPKMMPTSGPTHDVKDCRPSDYDRYWGRSAMAPYSFDVGKWHIIQLPSAAFRYNCNPAGVTTWLRDDLKTHRARCAIAFFHEPYWTRATTAHSRTREVKPWIDVLYGAGVDIVLNGHQHNYQRFAPQNPSDQADSARGIRSFVVGSGGIGFYDFIADAPNVDASDATTYGALKLVLKDGSYDWTFVRAAGGTFTDSGSGTCH